MHRHPETNLPTHVARANASQGIPNEDPEKKIHRLLDRDALFEDAHTEIHTVPCDSWIRRSWKDIYAVNARTHNTDTHA